MKVNVYMCSKPLQYFNIKNIVLNNNHTLRNILCIRNTFLDAENFIDKVRMYDKFWDEVICIKTKKEYHQYIRRTKIHNLIIENDASWLMWIHNLIGDFDNLYVFEEGIGTYNYINRKWFDKTLRNLLGVGTHYGDSYFCKGIFLYEPDLYNSKFQSKKALPLKQSFLSSLEVYTDLFRQLSPPIPDFLNIKGKKILMYVTNHYISEKVVEDMNNAKGYDILVIKPHPHIKNVTLTNKKIHILYTNLMMEYIIHNISKNNILEVWHFASTSMVYFSNKIKNVNLANFPIYNEFIEYLNKNK